MIEVENLTKKYGTFTAVNDISFSVKKGEILGFLGPNGAGKSTTMKMLTCFITPTSGTARVGGKDILTESLEVKKRVGYLPESAPSYRDMTVFEFLRFVASVRGYSNAELKKAVNKAIEITALERVCYQTISTLSKGYRQRTCFAQALIHDPDVLILDEPTDGLDPNQKHEMRNLIKNMSQEKAIILSTHILEEMEAVCSRAIIIKRGTIVADGAPQELIKRSSSYNVVSVNLDQQPDEKLLGTINALDRVEKVDILEEQDSKYKLQIFPKEKLNILSDINRLIHENDLNVTQIHLEKGQMNEVFRNLTIG